MCTSPDCHHQRYTLDDDLSDLLGDGPAREVPVEAKTTFERKGDDLLQAPSRATHVSRAAEAGHRYTEPCGDCRGTGSFYSYAGRYVGPCFKCKGKGQLTFKTSPEERAKARNAAERLRQQKADTLRANAEAWLEANPVEAEWLRQPITGSFTFHADMLEALHKYGSFTEKQEAAVRKAAASSAVRKAQWAAEKAEREANQADIQIDRIEQAFDAARASGLRKLKLRLAGFVFKPAGANSRNPGAIYVLDDSDTYLGKVQGGKFARSRDCTADVEAAVLAAAADPHAAAVAYGKQTGICACCGRELTNAESVALGIGPICRDKWGWA